MTAFTPRRRHPKIRTIAFAAYAAASAGGLIYFMQAVHIPKQVCVGSNPAAAPAPSSPHRSVPVKAGAGEEGQSVRDISFAGVSWKDDHGVPLPASAQAGPRDTAGGTASGYADTPLGALLAAVNIAARTSWQFGPQVFGPTIANQVTGRFAAQMLSSDQNAWDSGVPESVAGTEGTREVAYAIDSYAPAGATVEIVSAAPGAGADAVAQVQVVWQHGDWRLVAPPGGDWADSGTQVSPEATGFTPFPGQGD